VAGAPVPEPVLQVRGLTVEYETAAGPVRAVDGFDLDVQPGEFVGVVGESGCGKSTMLFGVAQLLNPPARVSGGSVLFQGRDLVTMTAKELGATRWRDLSVVMQSAMNALNPVRQLGAQFEDAMRAHGSGPATSSSSAPRRCCGSSASTPCT
jgi:peptide/nickel transport system ATP-binding protein